MIKFFYDSLETLQKVKFASKKDYISLGLGVIFAIMICGVFFVGVDTFFTGAYKTLYSSMRSDKILEDIYDDSSDTTLSGDDTIVSGAALTSDPIIVTGDTNTSTGS